MLMRKLKSNLIAPINSAAKRLINYLNYNSLRIIVGFIKSTDSVSTRAFMSFGPKQFIRSNLDLDECMHVIIGLMGHVSRRKARNDYVERERGRARL
jgi:hypothetical protein